MTLLRASRATAESCTVAPRLVSVAEDPGPIATLAAACETEMAAVPFLAPALAVMVTGEGVFASAVTRPAPSTETRPGAVRARRQLTLAARLGLGPRR